MSTWPKPYLLQIYSRAVSEGCVRVKLPSEAQFKSLSQAFYRLRRRADSQHASFILPEYHLVFATWEPEINSALFTYDALPDGHSLPEIETVTDLNVERMPAPIRREVMPATEEEPIDIEAMVKGLVDEAGQKLTVDDSDVS